MMKPGLNKLVRRILGKYRGRSAEQFARKARKGKRERLEPLITEPKEIPSGYSGVSLSAPPQASMQASWGQAPVDMYDSDELVAEEI